MSSNDKTPSGSFSDCSYIDDLERRRGKIISHTGGWLAGQGVFSHGYSMLEELVGEKSYFQILILNATGTLVDSALATWVEAVYGCLSWPDPRIWCNQVGALAGSSRSSVVAASCMGNLAADSRTYGIYPLIEAVAFIQSALQRHDQGLTPADIVDEVVSLHRGKPHIVGYKRPIARGDERLETMERVAEKLGFAEGRHLSLAYAIEAVLLERFGEGMNIAGYIAGFLADQGYSGQQTYRIFSTLVASGVTACYLDALDQAADAFLPLRCDDTDYQGHGPRPVPSRGKET